MLGVALVGLAFAGGRHDARDARLLGDAASTYWEGVRWGDANKAGAYLPGLDTRVALTTMLADPHVRLTDATVLQVELGADPGKDAARTAAVVVRLETIDVQKNRYETLTYVQHWEGHGAVWQVDAAQSPLGVDRPWVLPPAP